MKRITLISTRELRHLQDEFKEPTSQSELFILHGITLELQLRELCEHRFVYMEELTTALDIAEAPLLLDDKEDEVAIAIESRVLGCLD